MMNMNTNITLKILMGLVQDALQINHIAKHGGKIHPIAYIRMTQWEIFSTIVQTMVMHIISMTCSLLNIIKSLFRLL